MRRVGTASALGFALLGLSALAACGSGHDDPVAATSKSIPYDGSGALPDFTGKNLQSSQDAAQANGFFGMTSHDATGAGRDQLRDGNWKVCFQRPAPGSVNSSTQVDFGTVKTDEDCPPQDKGAPPKQKAPPKRYPNVKGMTLTEADAALPGSMISMVDGTGADDRSPSAEPDAWKVCSQDPKPGAKDGGRPIELTMVRTDEDC